MRVPFQCIFAEDEVCRYGDSPREHKNIKNMRHMARLGVSDIGSMPFYWHLTLLLPHTFIAVTCGYNNSQTKKEVCHMNTDTHLYGNKEELFHKSRAIALRFFGDAMTMLMRETRSIRTKMEIGSGIYWGSASIWI